MLKSLRNQRGMTLFEIIIVLVIVTSVASLLFKTVNSNMQKAKLNETKLRMSELSKSVEQYYADCGSYPQTLIDLKQQSSNCTNWGPVAYAKDDTLRDAWKFQFQYQVEGSRYTITSLGADKQPGGDGYNADITSSDQ